MVKRNWKPFEVQSLDICMFQMMDNLSTIKKLSKEWGNKFRELEQFELKYLEHKIQNIYNSNTTGIFSIEELHSLKVEEQKRNRILADEEKSCRIKSRALWLEDGDKNTKFFHRHASHRKNINTILEIKDEEGGIAQTFKDKAISVETHFQRRFTAPPVCPI